MPDFGVSDTEKTSHVVMIWDKFLRLFHWMLAFCVITTWLVAKFGPVDMTIHFWIGYAIAGLLVFRLIWGLVGSSTARFSHFIYSPAKIIKYIRSMPSRKPSNWFGHNPVGGLFVLIMLICLVGLVVTGLFADPEDYINVGPLAGEVSSQWNRFALSWHHRFGWLILALVVLHLLAISFYRFWKREDLVGPMVHGNKELPSDERSQ